MENSTSAKVQHLTKASSDELLNKFAQTASPKTDSRLTKRRKTTTTTLTPVGDLNSNAVVVERRSLLPPPSTRRRSSSAALIRHLGRGGRVNLGSKGFRNRSILGTIQKTWRKTVEGATKVLMEKHYKRLRNDIA